MWSRPLVDAVSNWDECSESLDDAKQRVILWDPTVDALGEQRHWRRILGLYGSCAYEGY